MSQPPVGTTAVGQSLVGTTRAGQPLEKITTTVRMIDLVLVVIVWSMLSSQENLKAKNWLSPKNCLSQENLKAKNRKNRQKVGIHLNSTLRRLDQAS